MMKRLICLFHKRVFLVLFSVGLMMPAGCGNSKPVVIEQPTYFNTKEAIVFELDEQHKNITKDTSCSVEPVVIEDLPSELGYTKAPKNEKGEFMVSKGVYKTKFNFTCKERKEIVSVTLYVESISKVLQDRNVDPPKEIPYKFFTKYSIISARKEDKNREPLFTDSSALLEKAYDYPIHTCQYSSSYIKEIYKHQAFIRFTDQTTATSTYSIYFNNSDFCTPILSYPREYFYGPASIYVDAH